MSNNLAHSRQLFDHTALQFLNGFWANPTTVANQNRWRGRPSTLVGTSTDSDEVSELFCVFFLFPNPEFCAEIGQIACVVPENVCAMMCNGVQECLEPMEEANCSE